MVRSLGGGGANPDQRMPLSPITPILTSWRDGVENSLLGGGGPIDLSEVRRGHFRKHQWLIKEDQVPRCPPEPAYDSCSGEVSLPLELFNERRCI